MIAVAVAVGAMLLALAPPLWTRTTGDEVFLEVAPVDPRSLFRGNYVDLRYEVDVGPGVSDTYGTVYVVFDDARPANVVRATASRPDLAPGERCVEGLGWGSGSVDFPSLQQFFVTPEQGAELETRLDRMLAVVRSTGSCRAVLVDLVPE